MHPNSRVSINRQIDNHLESQTLLISMQIGGDWHTCHTVISVCRVRPLSTSLVLWRFPPCGFVSVI